MAKLYELAQNYQNLMELLDNPEVPLDIIQKGLDEVGEELELKVENIAKVIKSIETDVSGFKEEEKRLVARRKSLEGKIGSLKSYIENSMQTAGKDKIKGKLFTLTIQKNAPSLDISDEKKIPKKYYVKQDPVLDKKSLLEALKEGLKVKGVAIKQTSSLRIR